MSSKKIVETFYGKHHKYEVVKEEAAFFGSSKYYVHKDGRPHRGPYESLHDAVEVAKSER